MNSIRDEIRFLLSGRGMPYQKVAFTVAIFVTIFFTLTLGNNISRNLPIGIIDLDNSKYSHEIVEKINSSPCMKVSTIIYSAVDPNTLFYEDKCVTVVVLPKDLEKDRYSQTATNIGVFYDNTNTALTADIRDALNEIVADENLTINGAIEESTGDSISQGMTLNTRNLFNPSNSSSNGESQGFLFFFSSMFFVFATIGMVPRLRIEGKLEEILKKGTLFDILLRLVPYSVILLTALFVGMAILRVANDMVFSGSIILFFVTQIFYISAVGIMSILFGWTAANPGVAASRMILFIPGGFIFGGQSGPLADLLDWVRIGSHFFPLVWEYKFVRDIMMRGAGFWDIANEFGGFLIYIGVLLIVFCYVFLRSRKSALCKINKT